MGAFQQMEKEINDTSCLVNMGFFIGLQSMNDIQKLYSVTKKSFLALRQLTMSGKNGRQQRSRGHAKKSMYIHPIVSRISKRLGHAQLTAILTMALRQYYNINSDSVRKSKNILFSHLHLYTRLVVLTSKQKSFDMKSGSSLTVQL